MALTDQDIRLMASQVLADVPEGGGRMTGNEVVDNVSNNLFADVSELDRTIGRVSLRKAFPAVLSSNRDAFYGANVIIDKLPDDPNVSVTLFTTGSWTDQRSAAVSRMESYLARGPKFDAYLWDQHIAGQRAILLIQRTDRELPNVGQTLVLVKNPGLSSEVSQFVRITKVTAAEQTFSASGCTVDFRRRVVTCEIGTALERDYKGGTPHCNDDTAVAAADTRVYTTVVADAARYAGMTKLAQAASQGALTVKAESIFTQLVPSAQVETPIVDALPYQPAGLPVPGAEAVTYTTSVAWSTTSALYLPGGCVPGSLTIETSGQTIRDAAGTLKTSTGSEIGSIDYANGVLTLTSGSFTGAITITYRPAAMLLRAPQSTEIAVTNESRSMTYVGMIAPSPQPGTLMVQYRAQGRWYVLQDTSDGTIKGSDSSYGAGSINYSTGGYVVTLGALPDVGSSIILVWNAITQETQLSKQTLKAAQRVTLTPGAGRSIQPGTLTLTWLHDGTKNASANAAGVISGAASGRVLHSSNVLEFAPNALPAPNTTITVNYYAGDKHEDHFAHPARNGSGQVPVTASQGAITPGSLEVEWNTLTDLAVLGVYTEAQLNEMGISISRDPTQIARDDGNGLIKLNDTTIGSVNYSTGAIVFTPDVTVRIPRPIYAPTPTGGGRFRLVYRGIEYVFAPSLYPNDETGYVNLRYNAPGSASLQEESFTFSPTVELTPGVSSFIVPGSVVLSVPGAVPYGDSGAGALREPVAGGYSVRGAIDYMTASVILSAWPIGAANSIERSSAVMSAGENISSEFVFRTAVAPLRPGSLTVRFTRAGLVRNVSANIDGTIGASDVDGAVDYQSGIVRLRFGRWVTAAGNETQPWFNPENVRDDGMIWRPEPVPSASIRYAAVAYTYIPLDKSILGIDPVRLPSDGRVPIFRVGDVAVVHHDASQTVTSLATPQTINLGRTRLSRVWIFDEGDADKRIDTARYTVDLDAGTVTLTNTVGLVGPLRIEHRIEDMALVSDVQISGDITLTKQITHDYPAGSGISSALVIGDMQARATPPFDQQTWTNVWSDTLIGSPTTAEYNATQFPIEVSNVGAIQERWALIFDTPTQVRVVGESVGQIAVASIASDISPINPATGAPYFTIRAAGWGGGWSSGNVLRFNTVAANFPVWLARTVKQGPGFDGGDRFRIQIRGDAN